MLLPAIKSNKEKKSKLFNRTVNRLKISNRAVGLYSGNLLYRIPDLPLSDLTNRIPGKISAYSQ